MLKEVIELIDRDLNAAKALDKMISDLAIFITTISNFIDPELVVLGGGSQTLKIYGGKINRLL